MTTDWESSFRSWAKPLGSTEQAKCENAERGVKNAIREHHTLGSMDITIFPQGSYAVRINVRQDSDVDVCIRLNNLHFFYDLPTAPPNTADDFGIIASSFTFREFKELVKGALVNRFGGSAVTPGDKAFEVHENTYRIDAHVVATFEHRRYTGQHNWDGPYHYLSGVELKPDSGGRLINWPQQT